MNEECSSVFIFAPDDITQIRSNKVIAARDNVVLESGLFIGRYGKDRNFIVAPRGVPNFHIPTDLLGITLAQYDTTRVAQNPQAAVGAACTSILTAIKSHRAFTTSLAFALSAQRHGSRFPLKLGIEIRNNTNLPVLVTSKYFRFASGVRPHMNAKGNPAQNRYEVKFAPPGSSSLNQFHALIQTGQSTSTWIPLDPTHTDQEVRDAINNGSCGELHYTCDWLGPDGWHREYVEQM